MVSHFISSTPSKRGQSIGITCAAVYIGIAFGPYAGGIIVDTISWRWAFYVSLPIAGFAAVVVAIGFSISYRKNLVKERLVKFTFTSAAGFSITLIWSILSMWRIYFLSVYFRAVQTCFPVHTGVQILPKDHSSPAVVIGDAFMKIVGRFALSNSWAYKWPLSDKGFSRSLRKSVDRSIGPHSNARGPGSMSTAAAMAFWAFIRNFGIIWGMTISSAIMNRFESLLSTISDPAVRASLSDGQAYERASEAFVD
ncbi:hypothetical protein N7470_006910 [Penicillium chermesinum]|nr:hypothetical protein N7470_006910 [Penicillium chermesinum]